MDYAATGKAEMFCFFSPTTKILRKLIELATNDFSWRIKCIGEIVQDNGSRIDTGMIMAHPDSRFCCLSEVVTFVGVISRAHDKLSWTSTTTLDEWIIEFENINWDVLSLQYILVKRSFFAVNLMDNLLNCINFDLKNLTA